MRTFTRQNRKSHNKAIANSYSKENRGSKTLQPGEHHPKVAAKLEMEENLNQSPRVQSQIQLQHRLNQSPSVVAQAKLAEAMNSRNSALQLQQATQRQEELEEEEPLQTKSQPIQKQETAEDEEFLQGRFNPVQKQEALEEEPLQGKFQPIQREIMIEEEEPLQGRFEPVQKSENRTGLPGDLKAGVENLSGMSMDDVKVHYNSAKPATVQALAYTQGTEIHVAPGQEKHLPHEAWHVVQQKEQRVKPTLQMKGIAINDDAGLEREADAMGTKAAHVMQQRAVVQSVGGIGQVGDEHGQNTDAVVERVASEQSAKGLPGRFVDAGGKAQSWGDNSVGKNPYQHASFGVASNVVQRVKEIVLSGGKRTKSFTVPQAAKIAAKNLEEEGYEGVNKEDIKAALEKYNGEQAKFSSMEAFVELVKTLLSKKTEIKEKDKEEEEEIKVEVKEEKKEIEKKGKERVEEEEIKEELSGKKEVEGINAGEFATVISQTLGKKESKSDFVQFYVKQLAMVIKRLDAGEVGIRWLTLEPNQKLEVLHRLIQAMVALGNSQGDTREEQEKFFQENKVILHGSYLFGAGKDQPGDIDLIVSGSAKVGKKIGIGGKLAREPEEAYFSVGSEAGLIDYMGGIPFSETEGLTDLSKMSVSELLKDTLGDLEKYKNKAYEERNEGKRARKFVNIAVAIYYLLSRIKAKWNELLIPPELTSLIAKANKAILSGSLPKDVQLAKEVEKALKILWKVKELIEQQREKKQLEGEKHGKK